MNDTREIVIGRAADATPTTDRFAVMGAAIAVFLLNVLGSAAVAMPITDFKSPSGAATAVARFNVS